MASTKDVQSYRSSGLRPTRARAVAASAGRRRGLQVAKAIASVLRPHLEAMESRVLLSAYGLQVLGYYGGSAIAANSRSPLIADSSGNFYGTASAGGAYGAGSVFEIAHGSNALTNLASFNGTNGEYPYGGLTLDSAGNLYGTAYQGGASNDGTVFEIANGSNAITALVTFDGTNGQHPQAGLTIDTSGNLYGTTGNTVFTIPSGSSAITTLATFSGSNGSQPYTVTLDAAGDLFGTTPRGGFYSDGSVFEVPKNGSLITLISFNIQNGSLPSSGLAIDGAGNIYGTTGGGGANADGTVFELTKGPYYYNNLV